MIIYHMRANWYTLYDRCCVLHSKPFVVLICHPALFIIRELNVGDFQSHLQQTDGVFHFLMTATTYLYLHISGGCHEDSTGRRNSHLPVCCFLWVIISLSMQLNSLFGRDLFIGGWPRKWMGKTGMSTARQACNLLIYEYINIKVLSKLLRIVCCTAVNCNSFFRTFFMHKRTRCFLLLCI